MGNLVTPSCCQLNGPAKWTIQKCINISIKAVEEWMKNNTKSPNEEIFEALVCTAIQNGNESVWSFVASQYSSIINPNNIDGISQFT
ncbi:unnamed protein product [Lepeophtheirus salmonis]|uniref:(salmon louse) hypothetical protein n=1 Tax=Lepeophtheirus salmonis TaxID=72036 RepID=A0A7R8H414_LEPSM|nr:unnamed protein product [Lepeophtheirus salmonis]CAF2851734.1 unnamed protein product [Lepeophtheirus salmonis]